MGGIISHEAHGSRRNAYSARMTCGGYLHASPRPHWHINYLRPYATLEEVWLCYDRKRREHLWAAFLSSMPGVSAPMAGFGSSDCGCDAHLFFIRSRVMRGRIRDALNVLQLILVHPEIVTQFMDDR